MIFSINICTSYGRGVLAIIFIIVQLHSKIIIIERFHASSVVDEHIIKLIMQLDLRRKISRKKRERLKKVLGKYAVLCAHAHIMFS